MQKSVKYDRILRGKQTILQISLAPGINRLNAFDQPLALIQPNFLKLAGTFQTGQYQFAQCGSLYKGEMRRRTKGILKSRPGNAGTKLGSVSGEAQSSVSDSQSLISLQISVNSSRLAGRCEV